MVQHKNVIVGVAWLAVVLIGVGIFYVYKGNLFKSPAPAPASDTAPRLNVILPRSKVTPEYYTAYNAIVNGFYALENVHLKDAAPIILEMQAAIAKKDSQELTTLAAKAKSINDMQKKRIASLSGNFNDLASASETLKDPKAKSLTANFIAAGRNVVAVYIAYNKLIDDMVSGKLTAQSITDAKAIEKNSPAATAAFRDATVKLTTYFNQTLASDLKAYLMAASSTISE